MKNNRISILYISGHHAHEKLCQSVSNKRYFIPNRNENWITYLLKIFLLSMKIPDCDVVVSESHAGKLVALALRKFLLRKNFICIVRANDHFFNFDGFPWYKRIFVKFISRYIDGVIAISDMVMHYVKKNTNLPVRKVNTFVEKDFLDIKPNLTGRNIVSIGTYFPRKGNDILMEIDKKLRKKGWEGYTFILGPIEIVPKFILEYSKLQPKFRFVGVVDPKRYFEKCCFYVHPSRFDAAGCSVLEAMGAGLIPIVSKNTGNKEIVEQVDKTLIVDNKPICFYKKISELLNEDEERLKELSVLCKKVAEKYVFEKVQKEFIKNFEKILNEVRHNKN